VPARRSGMAASAANTSREIGAVLGVSILGSLVSPQLQTSLLSQLKHLGVPPTFNALILNALETGGVPPSGNSGGAGGAAGAGHASEVQQVISAAYGAFYTGLRAALVLSAILVLAAGLVTLVLLRRRDGTGDPGTGDLGTGDLGEGVSAPPAGP
jgi:hypothetical protein